MLPSQNPLIFPLQLVASTTNCFSILSWNTLASNLSDAKSFPKADPTVLDFVNYRWNLIKKIIMSYNADVIALMEVKDIESYKSLLEAEYEVHWKPKSTDDGVLVAVRREIFKVEGVKAINFDSFSQYFWSLNLRHLPSQRLLHVYATHLKAKPEFENIRTQQIEFFIAHTAQQRQETVPAIFCGDFNTEPNSPSIELLVQQTAWRCAYEGTPITTFKTRAVTVARKIDYIFYDTQHFNVLLRSQLPKGPIQEGDAGYPNFEMPSDHLPLYSIFQFQNQAPAEKKQ